MKGWHGETAVARGARAESLAASYLARCGYRVIARNHRCRGGEIDLIAWDGDVLCFVEVRARARQDFGTPLETITPQKIRRIVQAARDYASRLRGPWPEMRFDAVGIVLSEPPSFELVRGAFEA